MTTDLRLFDITLNASGDDTNNQYKGVFATSSDALGEYAVVDVLGARAIGVLQDKSTAAGIASLIRVAGISKMQAGASSVMPTAITEGIAVSLSSVGQAVFSSAAGTAKIGTALESLATDSTGIIRVLLGVGLTT